MKINLREWLQTGTKENMEKKKLVVQVIAVWDLSIPWPSVETALRKFESIGIKSMDKDALDDSYRYCLRYNFSKDRIRKSLR